MDAKATVNIRERACLYGANAAESLSRKYLGAGELGAAAARGVGAALGVHAVYAAVWVPLQVLGFQRLSAVVKTAAFFDMTATKVV